MPSQIPPWFPNQFHKKMFPTVIWAKFLAEGLALPSWIANHALGNLKALRGFWLETTDGNFLSSVIVGDNFYSGFWLETTDKKTFRQWSSVIMYETKPSNGHQPQTHIWLHLFHHSVGLRRPKRWACFGSVRTPKMCENNTPRPTWGRLGEIEDF